MFEELKKLNREILDLAEEIKTYKQIETRIKKDLKLLNKKYSQGEYDYEKYQLLRKKILSNHSVEEEIESFESYIRTLTDKVEYLNTQIFLSIYEDKKYSSIKKEKKTLPILQKFEEDREEKKVERIVSKIDDLTKKTQNYIEPEIEISEIKAGEDKIFESYKSKKVIDELKTNETKSIIKEDKKETIPWYKKIFKQISELINPKTVKTKKKETTKIETVEKTVKQSSKTKKEPLMLKPEFTEVPKEIEIELKKAEKSNKKTALDLLKEEQEKKKNPLNILNSKKRRFTKEQKESLLDKFQESEKIKKSDKVNIGGILNIGFIKRLFGSIKNKDKYLTKQTKEAHSFIELKGLLGDNSDEIRVDNTNFLTKEAGQLKQLLNQTTINVYNPTSIGFLANFFTRKFTLYLIESYPEFFKKFYLILRQANIKILSNTYLNIMFFVSFLVTLFTIVLTIFVSLIQKNPIELIFAKTFVMSIVSFSAAIGGFYYYPTVKVNERLKSINTNLPFAIDQMSSVVSSGVPPATMFKLIAKTKEYGEVSVEIEKISNLVEVFGYDIISSVRSVTSTTPSKILKEFFEGFISTVETGGSLKNYLSQKSKEAMLAYQTERQKYVESISTYSDIYTGLLIAAPLFFVSTLSLVSLLGGTVGGMEVSTVISIGTYIVIPVLNILFIVFLELNQPQV